MCNKNETIFKNLIFLFQSQLPTIRMNKLLTLKPYFY